MVGLVQRSHWTHLMLKHQPSMVMSVRAYSHVVVRADGKMTGYIHISAFGHDTAAETRHAIRILKGRGAVQFVIDLRGNGGGVIRAGQSPL